MKTSSFPYLKFVQLLTAAVIVAPCLLPAQAISESTAAPTSPPIPPPANFILKSALPSDDKKPNEPSGAQGELAKIPDYDSLIKSSLKERERRLALLNEALLRLRDAGEISIARHVETRIQNLVEMPDPLISDAVIDQIEDLGRQNEKLKTENKELAVKLEKKPDSTEDSKVISSSYRRSR